MKVIAYLGFTLLSIMIQFCLMDLTNKNNLKEDQVMINGTSNKERFQDLLKTFTEKPHALYYRTLVNSKVKESIMMPLANSINDSAQGMDTTTTSSSTVIDELYDENYSTTEDAFTTESMFTNSEFDNVTEISFFDKKNQSTIKPGVTKKQTKKDCSCNLLYEVCDINCCCDSDCSDSEQKLFINCKDISKKTENAPYLCYPYQYFLTGEKDNIIDNLFCIVKTNLPEKRNLHPKKYEVSAISQSYKWHRLSQPKHTEFERKPYEYGNTVWVLKKSSIWYIDIPSPTVNNYCNGRSPILFLHNMNVKCIVNMKDLEMIHILQTSKEAPCISVTENSINSTALNCSTLYCTNWTTIICNDIKCVDYNESIHEPSCTERYCTNVALKLEYIFHYYDAKIMNATLKLYTQTVPVHIPYMNQEITVKFMLTNESIDKVTEISGNPGYIHGRPIISSVAENNRSLNFLNLSTPTNKYLSYPGNKNGICSYSVTRPELILFGLNRRTSCRYVFDKKIHYENSTDVCNEILRKMEEVSGLTRLKLKTYVSPYGNPLDVKDTAWVPIQVNLNEEITYGQFISKNSKLRCYNLVTRISYMFTFADVSERTTKRENKIVSANVSVTTQNITFRTEDVSTVLTVDINFIDGTKPRVYEYAAGPYINVRLPHDFFFPFRSNKSYMNECQSVIILICFVMYQQIK